MPYQCAVCGFDGALGRNPVGIQAAQVRWHSQDGPDEVANGLALCALHHVLLDLGVLGLTPERRVRVSALFVARSEAGQALDALAGRPLLVPRRPAPGTGGPRCEGARGSWRRAEDRLWRGA